MYSVVLATMLTAGSAAPAFGHHGCHSCYSSCHSCYSSYSCYSCYSCYTCYGCYGGHGGLFHHNRGCYCSSCYSSCCSCYSSCCGGYYYSSCCGGYICCGGTVITPQVVPVPTKGEPVNPPKKEQARVTVTLPSDARLWVDSVECPLTSGVRSFNTPELVAGQRYVYNIRAEIVREGRTITETQRVVLTPGTESRVDFSTNGGAVATASR
jgi:uncharacterized protein (TIGR03000 family)